MSEIKDISPENLHEDISSSLLRPAEKNAPFTEVPSRTTLGGFLTPHQPCIDINFTPYSGAENIIFLQKSFEEIENNVLPIPPSIVTKELGNVRYSSYDRMLIGAKAILFWIPFNCSCLVTQHEIFGHGYRVRDLGSKYAEITGYKMYVIFGSTYMEITDKLTLSQSIAINIAGLEADEILAHKLKMKWLSSGRIDPRQGSLYTLSSMSLTGYAWTANENATTVPKTGNDIINFLFELNALYRDSYLSCKTLRNLSLINLVDPFFIYSTMSEIIYINYGLDMKVPMFQIGPVRYLPSPRLALTPFGMQGYLDNFFVFKSVPTYLYLKWGKNGINTYYGVGVENPRVFNWKTASLGFRADLWRQPSVIFQQGALSAKQIDALPSDTPVSQIPQLYPTSLLTKRFIGGALSIIGTYGLVKWPARLYLELGYKSDGYLPGEALRASPIVRGGLSGQF
jgi:hypothetical protein